MAYYNQVAIIGNLAKDPEVRLSKDGMAVCKIVLASNRQFKNKKNGQMEKEVCFIDATTFGPQAEYCGKSVRKGSEVLVHGRIKQESWQDEASGVKHNKHCIIAERVVALSRNQPTEFSAPENKATSVAVQDGSSASQPEDTSEPDPLPF